MSRKSNLGILSMAKDRIGSYGMCAAMVVAAGLAVGTASAQEKLRVGVTVWDVSSTPGTVPLITGLKEAAEAADIDLTIADPKWDASMQVENLREFVVKDMDVVAVTPIDVVGIIPAAKESEAAGVPVVAVMGEVEGFPYIGTDDVEYGRQSGRLILQALADVEGPKRVVMFRGTAGGSPDRLRWQGMNEVIDASGEDIEWVSVTADWLPDQALTGFQDVLQRFPNKGDIALVNSMGNCMIPPSLDWAKRQNREEIKFISMDLCKSEEEAIGSGAMYGSVYQDPRVIGQLAIKAMVAMHESGDYDTVPLFAAEPPLNFCTKANFSDCEGRGY